MKNLSVLTAIQCAALAVSAAPAEKTPRPNIIFILADDLGFEGVGAYGGVNYKGLGSVRTPNLDAMAKNGMLFKRSFACAVCSPSRAELLTGQYNFRSGFIAIAGVRGAVSELDENAHPTLAMRLKAAGYETAVAGKWHIGPPDNKDEFPSTAEADTQYEHVKDCGFDRQCVFGGGHLEHFGEPVPGKYTPDVLQKWVLNFLNSRKDQPQPFFLYYASPFPHAPYYPTPLNPDGPQGGRHGDLRNFPYMVEYLDQQVGEILNRLKELGMSENTLVFFAGDNGGPHTVTTEMRDGREITGGKGSPLDTGSWVPMLASWPGVIAPGSVYNDLVDFSDITPTCLALAGVPEPSGLDGISFAPQLQGLPGTPRTWIHVLQLTRYFARDLHWKLRENGSLYDVSDSPYEETRITNNTLTPEAEAARTRLQAVLDQLHPNGSQKQHQKKERSKDAAE